MINLESYVAGRWQAGAGRGSELHNPTTGEPIGTTSTDGLDLAGALVYARDRGGPALRAMSFAQRGEVLGRMGKALRAAREELIDASILNAGTTRSDAKFDIDGAIGTLAYYASLGQHLGDRSYAVEGDGVQLTRSPRFWGHHVRVPRRGAAIHINAFNFPAWGLAEKAAVALLAGMPVVSKPASSTALLAFRVMQRLVSAEILPDGALQLVCGGAGDLLEHVGSQDVLAFTGSGSTGVLLRGLRQVVGHSVRVNVEADSLNAAVLTVDADPGSETYAMFIRDVVREMTQKTGQKCTATRRIFVPSAVIDRVEADLREQLAALTVGDPALAETRMGPLATAQQLRDVRAGIARLVEAGARVVHGSAEQVALVGADAARGYFLGPVLLRADSPRDAKAVHEHEVFGPVSSLMPYASSDEAVELVAMGDGGLVASIYGDDRDAIASIVLGIAPYHGRITVGSRKVADQATPPGVVLPSCVHGGPGRAGGGEELGGERGLAFYTQRTAVQGDRALLERILGPF